MYRFRFLLRHNSAFRRNLLDSNAQSCGKTCNSRDFKTFRILQSEKSDNSDNSENPGGKENPVPKSDGKAINERSEQAKAKLSSLLQSIVEDSKKDASEATTERNLNSSAIDMKLAAPVKEKRVPEKSEQTVEEKETEQDLGKEMVAAVKKVVDSNPDVVESELVQKLKSQVGKKANLSDLFAGMKIDRSPKAGSTGLEDMELSRAHRVRRLLDERTNESKRVRDDRRGTSEQRPRQRRVPVSPATYVPIDLFGAPPLGIFHVKTDSKASGLSEPKAEVPRLDTWEMLAARDLKLSITHPPANGFEEMILWTEQGKLWKFPIDNEQGLDEEAKVPFHEHVFLEHKIEEWCPKK